MWEMPLTISRLRRRCPKRVGGRSDTASLHSHERFHLTRCPDVFSPFWARTTAERLRTLRAYTIPTVGQDGRLPTTLFNLVQADSVTRLKAVVELRRQVELLQAELVEQVLHRDDDPPWEELGKLLGMSKNTAQKRYGHLAPESKKRSG